MTTVCGKEVELPDPKDNVAVVTYVRDRLLEQGKKSIGNGFCRLRGEDNCACALGWLISDDKYKPAWNSGTGDARYFLCESEFDYDLLCKMQAIHDRLSPETWEYAFNKLIKD